MESILKFASDFYKNIMKKRTFLTFLLTVFVLVGRAQTLPDVPNSNTQIRVAVSEEVELMAVVAISVGAQEFGDSTSQYYKETKEYFADYQQHPAITYFREIRNAYGLAYERVTSMAVHLEIVNDKVRFVGNPDELPGGWKYVNIKKFIKLLGKFYKDSHFHEFFEQHKPFYEEYLRFYQPVLLSNIHPEWYSRFFYGTEQTDLFCTIIGFNYGSTNNGVWRQLPSQSREVFDVMGFQMNPGKGLPYCMIDVVVHEYAHSYVNSLLESPQNAAMMESVGQQLLQLSLAAMNRQAYGEWPIVINESIVRAAVIIYLMDNGFNQNAVQVIMQNEVNRGFLWMPELVASLQNYAAHRDQYKTLNDYYPEIARCLQKYLDDKSSESQKALQQ